MGNWNQDTTYAGLHRRVKFMKNQISKLSHENRVLKKKVEELSKASEENNND